MEATGGHRRDWRKPANYSFVAEMLETPDAQPEEEREARRRGSGRVGQRTGRERRPAMVREALIGRTDAHSNFLSDLRDRPMRRAEGTSRPIPNQAILPLDPCSFGWISC